MRFLFYLSKRTLFHRQSDQFIPFIRVLAVAGLMIGTAAMAITMGILHGFEKNLVEKISDFESHCRIESFRDKLEIDFDYMEKIQRHPDVIQMAPYLDLNVMVRKNDETEGIILQCLQQPDFMEILSKSKKNMSGKVDFRAGRQLPGIYLGQGVAQSLNATTGDTVDVLMLNGIPSLFNPLKTYPAIITGVFSTGMKEFDAGYGYTSLYFGQLKVKRSSIITGYQLLLTDPMKASEICEWIEDKSDYHYMAMTWKERNRILFRWLETQKAPILITFGIIALVAVFNIVSTLVMIVLVKEKDIAVLKSMGMTPRNIRRKYIIDGLFISLVGSFAGILLARILQWGQMTFAWFTISSDIYYIDRVPIDISPQVGLIIILSTVGLALLATLYPATSASRVKPVKVLRYE